MITRKDLHKVEMELVNLLEENRPIKEGSVVLSENDKIMKEAIIDKFTNLMNEVITKEQIESLKKLIEYNYESENKHYLETLVSEGIGHVQDHIFNDIRELSKLFPDVFEEEVEEK